MIVFYLLNVDLARGFVAAFVPWPRCSRSWVATAPADGRPHARRYRRRAMHWVLVVGTMKAATDLIRHFQRVPYAGFQVVAACVPGEAGRPAGGRDRGPRVRWVRVGARRPGRQRGRRAGVAGDSALPPGALKTLAWGLEGTGVDLTVAPAVTEVVMPTATARGLSPLRR